MPDPINSESRINVAVVQNDILYLRTDIQALRVELRDQTAIQQMRTDFKEAYNDHEDRLRSLEKRNVWGHVLHGAAELFAIILAALGFRQP